MGRTFDTIGDAIRDWVAKQSVFFVGTAPKDVNGHINVSPKGSIKTFQILGDNQIAYVDLIGSGIESTAHLQENGRIVVMFCAFAGPPKIVRFHGRGRVVADGEPEFRELIASFGLDDQTRQLARSVIVVDVTRISDSCGFIVPELQLVKERDQHIRWGERKERQLGQAWKQQYMAEKNSASIDGLPGLDITVPSTPD